MTRLDDQAGDAFVSRMIMQTLSNSRDGVLTFFSLRRRCSQYVTDHMRLLTPWLHVSLLSMVIRRSFAEGGDGRRWRHREREGICGGMYLHYCSLVGVKSDCCRWSTCRGDQGGAGGGCSPCWCCRWWGEGGVVYTFPLSAHARRGVVDEHQEA